MVNVDYNRIEAMRVNLNKLLDRQAELEKQQADLRSQVGKVANDIDIQREELWKALNIGVK